MESDVVWGEWCVVVDFAADIPGTRLNEAKRDIGDVLLLVLVQATGDLNAGRVGRTNPKLQGWFIPE